MLRTSLIIAAIVLGVIVVPQLFKKEYQQFEMPGHRFCVPNKYLVDTSSYWWIDLIKGLDESRAGFLFHFRGAGIAKSIEGFTQTNGEVEQFASGLVSYLTQEEIDRAKTEHPWGDLWYGVKGYEGRSVEQHKKSGLFKVYEFENKRTWYLFRIPPDETKPAPKNRYNFIVAGCQELSSPTRNGKPIHDRKPTSCSGNWLEGNLDISYSFSMDNAHLLPELHEYVISKLKEWEKCGV